MSKKKGNIFSKLISLVKKKNKNLNREKDCISKNKDINLVPQSMHCITNDINRNNTAYNYQKKLLDIDNSQAVIKKKFIIELREKLKKTRKIFTMQFKNIFSKNKIDSTLFYDLEERLLLSDIGFDTTQLIINNLKKKVFDKNINNIDEVYSLLQHEMLKILSTEERSISIDIYVPYIILVVGVNGVGKTTTIGKLAHKYKTLGKSVMLAAADTFRAAAMEQLQEWGIKNKISVISSHVHADAASVAFDAIKAARAKKIDVVIIDTAGRLHNKINLMKELQKIKDVIYKIDNYAPHEIMLVLDACNGQNSLQQTKLFHKYLNVTGIILTKLDSTAKGGIIFSIANKFSIPIRYIGIGEKIHDLKRFNSDEFIKSIF